MLSAFDLSYRVQELRLTYWARHREGLNIPPALAKEDGFNKLRFLADLLLNHDLKRGGFVYVLEFDQNYSRFCIELLGVAHLVDLACTQNISFAQTYFPPPRPEHPYIHIYPFDSGVYVLDQQINELQFDLQIYRKLQKELAAADLLTKSSSKLTWEQEFHRNLRWNRHARLAKTEILMQRNLLQELIRIHTPTQPEDDAPSTDTPVRVRVEEGHTLEEAIMLALRTL